MNMEIFHWLGVVLKWLGGIVGAIIFAVVLVIAIARVVTYCRNRITTKNGIDEAVFVPLCGQEQYLLIRGKDKDNPVIIWLHGGPSGAESYANYAFGKHLVDDYTLVSWDQRGCGRTYCRNRKADPNNDTATFQQAQQDLDALVDYVCERFGKDQVILMGHSYGTMLGSKYALTHPEKVAAYIGVGQVVNLDSDVYSYQDALQKAKAKGDDTTAMEAAYQTYLEDGSLMNMLVLRSKVMPYHQPEIKTNTIWLGLASPYMGINDVRWFMKQLGDLEDYLALNRQLYSYVQETDVRDYGMEYAVPVGFITGSCDWTTPVKFAQDYYDGISAPQKQIHLLAGCGHAPHYDLPEKFAATVKAMLKEYLR